MIIRPALEADLEAIAELLFSLSEYPNFQKMGLEAVLAQVTKSFAARHDQQRILVAELEGRVVGYATIYWMTLLFMHPEGYVSELFVHSDASGLGIGTALLEQLKLEAKVHGCQRLTLINLMDRESYQRQFYAKQGWREQKNAVRFVLNLEE
jgi:GNAT superfamily N-acetyltransferase